MSLFCKAITTGIKLQTRLAILNVNGFGRQYRGLMHASNSKILANTNCQLNISKRYKAVDAQPEPTFIEVLDREIQDETAELGHQLSSDQFPGFSVETDGAEVKLTKQVGSETVSVRFNVSSSLNEWPSQSEESQSHQNENEFATELFSMPDFQVQISKGKTTLEFSCYYEQPDDEEAMDQSFSKEPIFNIDELVLYENEPKETEFSVNADYFHEDLQNSLLGYLSERGIDEKFGKDLVNFATNYEKKQYVGLMKRLRTFVAK